MTPTRETSEHAMDQAKKEVAELYAHGVLVQLPKFNKTSPQSWFQVCEANFNVRGVTASDTRYWHAVEKLDEETQEEIQEFLEADLGEDPYGDLKKHLCEVFEATTQQKLDRLLATTSMGDKWLSTFLRELQRLVNGVTIQQVVRRVFTRSLPPRIATAVARNEEVSLFELGKDADSAFDEIANDKATTQTVAAISRQAGRGRWTGRGAFCGATRGKAGTRPQPQRLDAQTENRFPGGLCMYHAKFGDESKHCVSSCSRWAVRQGSPANRVFHIEEELSTDVPAENF